MDTIWAVGRLESIDYHKAKHIIQVLGESHPQQFNTVATPSEGFTEFQWNIKKDEIKQTVNNNSERCLSQEVIDVAVYFNGQLTFTISSLIKWASDSLLPQIQESLEQIDFNVLAQKAYNEFISNEKFAFVYMKLSLEGNIDIGELIIQLFHNLCPKTVDNFISLCSIGITTQENKTISYNDCCIHRIVPNGWIQSGDIIDGSGTNGMSIYGNTFPDESYAISHDSPGIIGMVNKGRNTNSSQFYITLKPTLWMNGQLVAFGRVIKGTEVLKQIESLNTYNERPTSLCYISDCGVLKRPN